MGMSEERAEFVRQREEIQRERSAERAELVRQIEYRKGVNKTNVDQLPGLRRAAEEARADADVLQRFARVGEPEARRRLDAAQEKAQKAANRLWSVQQAASSGAEYLERLEAALKDHDAKRVDEPDFKELDAVINRLDGEREAEAKRAKAQEASFRTRMAEHFAELNRKITR